MKRVTSAISDPGVGDGWFKLASMGYDSKTEKWCTQRLIEQNGLLDLGVRIPESLAGGYYLVRPEILSLHDADKSLPQPQFYTGCAQVFIASEGTMVPRDTVSIPGYVGIEDKAVLFDVWNPIWPYVEAGPEVYVPGKSPGRKVESVQRQDEGLLPGNARIVNVNWWGIEVDGYVDEEGCWNVSLLFLPFPLPPSFLSLIRKRKLTAFFICRPVHLATIKLIDATRVLLLLDRRIVKSGKADAVVFKERAREASSTGRRCFHTQQSCCLLQP